MVTDALSRKQSTELNQAQCLSFVYARLVCSVFIKGVGVGHSGKDNFDQLGIRVTILSIIRGRQETGMYGIPSCVC